MSESSTLVGKEKTHYEAVKKLHDLSTLPSKEISSLVDVLIEMVDNWNKMMGGNSKLPQICHPYLKKIKGNDIDAARKLYFYLSPMIFYVQALHEASKGSQRNVVINCGIFSERIVNNSLSEADRRYNTNILDEMNDKKFEDKNGKLKGILAINHFDEADELYGSLKNLYSMRNRTGPHDVPPPIPLQAKISINQCLSAYMQYLHALMFLGVNLEDDIEDFLSFFSTTTETRPTLIFGEDSESISPKDFIKDTLYREGFFQGGKSLGQVMKEMEKRRYVFNKSTVSNSLKDLCSGKDAVLTRKSGVDGFEYFERIPPSTYFKTVL
jgi:hypothetical protein